MDPDPNPQHRLVDDFLNGAWTSPPTPVDGQDAAAATTTTTTTTFTPAAGGGADGTTAVRSDAV